MAFFSLREQMLQSLQEAIRIDSSYKEKARKDEAFEDYKEDADVKELFY